MQKKLHKKDWFIQDKFKIVKGTRSVNLAFITGKLVNIQDMQENVKIGRLEDDLETYLLVWQDELIPQTTIGKHICVFANIATAKIKLEDKAKPYLTTVYRVKEIEIVDDI